MRNQTEREPELRLEEEGPQSDKNPPSTKSASLPTEPLLRVFGFPLPLPLVLDLPLPLPLLLPPPIFAFDSNNREWSDCCCVSMAVKIGTREWDPRVDFYPLYGSDPIGYSPSNPNQQYTSWLGPFFGPINSQNICFENCCSHI